MEEKAFIGPLLGVVLGFLLGNTNKLIIDPVVDLKKVINECLYILTFRANYLCNPLFPTSEEYRRALNEKKLDGENFKKYEDAALDVRMESSRLRIATDSVVLFSVFYFLRIIPAKNDLYKTADILMRLSNSIPIGKCQENIDDENKCRKLLGASISNQTSQKCSIRELYFKFKVWFQKKVRNNQED